ncbi:hypothetical protein ACTA71_006170 [Dictyostelium dimigraforme]
MFKKLFFISFFFALFSLVISEQLTLTQTQSSSWSSNGKPFSVWNVRVMNTGSRTIYGATIIGVSNLELQNIWSVEQKSSNKFSFPKFVSQNGGLKNGTFFDFGYINNSFESAIFSVCDIIN